MPRDFVPCLYYERELEDDVSQAFHRRYEVVEAFDMCVVETGLLYQTLTRDSHAYHVGVTFSACARRELPPDELARIDRHERARLFDTFYAAMAALE